MSLKTGYSPAPRFAHLAIMVSAAACCLSTGVAAQEPGETDNTTPPASASTTAGNDSVQLDTIVVTSRLRKEVAQDVPISMTVLGGEDTRTGGAPNWKNLYLKVPSMRVVNVNPRNVGMTIRGLGASLASDMLVNSVGVFVDGVYHPRPGAAAFDLMDIARIEILRGPQGTLFGKNTTAGAIRITTRRPQFQLHESVQLSAGNYGYRRLEGMVTGPLSDSVAGRLTVSTASRDGFVTNVRTGQDLNDHDNVSLRAQLLFVPDRPFTVRVAADYSRQSLDCCVGVIDKIVTTYDDGTPIPFNFHERAALLGYDPLPVEPFARRTDIDSRQHYDTQRAGLSATLNWFLDGGYKLTSISAYRNWSYSPYNDLDMIGLPILTQGAFFSESRTITQDLRLTSPSNRDLQYVAGLYYMYDRVISDLLQRFGAAAGPWILPMLPKPLTTLALKGLQGTGRDRVNTHSLAAYGHGTWRATDRLDVGFGLRYTRERKSGFAHVGNLSGAIPLSQLPAALVPVIKTIRMASIPAYDTRDMPVYPDDHEEGNFSGTLSATWQAGQHTNFYARYARGYKSGGINFGASVPTTNTIIKPEKVDSYEVGLKSLLLDNKLAINLDLYRAVARNYQTSRVYSSPTGATTIYVANVPKIRTQGFELDTKYTTGDGFSLGFSAAYTDAEYVSAANMLCTGVNSTGVCNLTGRDLPDVSEWAGHLNANYAFSTQGSLRPYIGAGVSYRSGFYSGPSSRTWVPGFTLVNFRVGARFENYGTDVSFWVNNAFEEEYYIYRNWLIFNTGAIVARLGKPRTYGVTVKMRF